MNWTEKHRPLHLKDVAGNQKVIGELKKYAKLKVGDLPNLLFYGPPGIGKTSTALAFCFDGNHAFEDINSPQVSGKDDVDKFAHMLRSVGAGISNFEFVEGQPSTEGYILIFDKAEMLTEKAQNLLEKALESRTDAKAIFLVNDVKRLTDAMITRFTTFEFKKLNDEEVKKLLIGIAKKENIDVPDYVLNKIVAEAEGVPRSAITALEKYWVITTH